MKMILLKEATSRLADAVEKAKPNDLTEYFSEMYPEQDVPKSVDAKTLANAVRTRLYPEEIVDLWNVVFSAGPSFYYNEEDEALCERALSSRTSDD